MGRIDDGLSIAERPDVIFAAFGDMMRVPGTKGSPLDHQARGMDVRIVYSPLDALKLARTNPDRHVMFFAIGFETTAPSTALTLMRAKAEGISNFSVFCNHVTIIPAIRAILDSPDMRLDAFVGPGHVSTVIGCRPYEWIAARRRQADRRVRLRAARHPAGASSCCCGRSREGRATVENQYKRVVPWEGNRAALRAMAEVFELRPYFEWRGLGFISQSALRIRDAYADWDAERRFTIPSIRVTDPKAAQCGEVLKGVLKPAQCKLFGSECTPERPVGALMVSSEGSCAAYFNYEHRKVAADSARRRHERRSRCRHAAPTVRFREPQIEMAHGAGGKASRRLVEGLFAPLLVGSRRAARRRGAPRDQRHAHRDHGRQLRRPSAAVSRAARSASSPSTAR